MAVNDQTKNNNNERNDNVKINYSGVSERACARMTERPRWRHGCDYLFKTETIIKRYDSNRYWMTQK